MQKEIAVKDIKDLLENNIVEIMSADGWVNVLNYFDNGIARTHKFVTKNHSIPCTMNHLLDTETGMREASSVKLGDKIITNSGLESVLEIIENGEIQVCDLEIEHENHRFYANGISVHNCNRKGFDDMLTSKDHLYSLLAVSDYNAIERDSTIILSIARTPEDEASRQARLQCLKSRESKKPLPFLATFDGETGAFYTSITELSDEEIVDTLEELEL